MHFQKVAAAVLALCRQDYKFGFGGEFGVEYAAIDKSAESWDYYQQAQKHPSQIGKNIGSVCLRRACV